MGTPATRLLLVGDEPALEAAATEAAAKLGVPLDIMPDVDSALAWLLMPAHLCTHVLAPASLSPQRLDALAGMVDEVTSRPTPLLLLGADPEQAQGSSVLAMTRASAAAIEQAVRSLRPFVPQEPPELSAAMLKNALHGGMIRMRFQPVLDADTLEPVGLEALARLHHPDLGILHPRHFIQLAADTGQERALTGIAAAATMVELGRIPGLPQRHFGINVSLPTLCHAHATERALEMCAAAGLQPDQVAIEVLETEAEPDMRLLGHSVERWRKAGFFVTIDDAGPRLPHWERLLDLPFSSLKLDGALAGPLPEALDFAGEIVRAAKRHGMFVIAEGIEDEAALARMRGLGVDALQGFLFCRPLPARALPIWLRAWRAGLLARPRAATESPPAGPLGASAA
jgi:EAL domain-containing protein (putative c-di-GMP-specific phosphodiesterase class I)